MWPTWYWRVTQQNWTYPDPLSMVYSFSAPHIANIVCYGVQVSKIAHWQIVLKLKYGNLQSKDIFLGLQATKRISYYM